MTTVTVSAPAAQPLLAYTDLPLIPRGRGNRRFAGSIDLRGLSADQLLRVGRAWWGRCAYSHLDIGGIALEVAEVEVDDVLRVDVIGASVTDLAAFEARFGSPVTHERAEQIARDIDTWTLEEWHRIEAAAAEAAMGDRGCL